MDNFWLFLAMLLRAVYGLFILGGTVYLIVTYGWSAWWMLPAIILAPGGFRVSLK